MGSRDWAKEQVAQRAIAMAADFMLASVKAGIGKRDRDRRSRLELDALSAALCKEKMQVLRLVAARLAQDDSVAGSASRTERPRSMRVLGIPPMTRKCCVMDGAPWPFARDRSTTSPACRRAVCQ